MTDTEIINQLQSFLEAGTARINFIEDDKDMDDEEDDWGVIPRGFSIRVRACNDFDVNAKTLRECVEMAVRKCEAWESDEYDEDDDE